MFMLRNFDHESAASTRRALDRNTGSPLARVCASINLAMSAMIFTGDLQEVLPGELAVWGEPGKQCGVCKSCKGSICKVLR
jgi:hypothetical protein